MQTSHTISAVTPRRSFFRHLLAEAIGLVEEARGKPQMRLSDLNQVPDEIVRQMIPVLNEEDFYLIEDDCVLFKQKKTGTYQELCRLDTQQSSILDYFDGQHTLEEIGALVAEEFGQGQEFVYQQAKALFLFLAKRAICFPVYTHDKM